MRLSPRCFALLLLAARPLFAADSAPALDAGLNVTLEGSAGLTGGAETGQALHALSLAHLAWKNTPANPSAPHVRAYASILHHEGRGPTGRFLGDVLAASNIEAFDSTRLYAWWVETTFADWSCRVGALLADEEFAGTAAGGFLTNSVFGWPAFISANTVNTGPAFFVAAPGLRLAHQFSPSTTWRVGVYDGDTFDSRIGDPSVNRHGFSYHLGGAQGWFLITELAFAPTDSPTRLKFGVWHHTATFADQQFDDSGGSFALRGTPPHEHSGNTGGYAVLEHCLAGVPEKPGHLDGFARFGVAPADRNTFGWVVDTGLAWTGPFSGRPSDVLACGFAHADFGSPVVTTARLLDAGAPHLDFEQVFEASYTAAFRGRFWIKPGLQYVRHPGGSRAQRDAVLALLRVVVDF